MDRICKSAETNLIIRIDALICAGNIVELPTIGLIALILEDSVISIEIFGWFWPLFNIAATTDSCTRIDWRAAVVGSGIFTTSSSLSACTADQISFHWIVCDWAKNIKIFSNLICIENSCTNTHAIFTFRLYKGQFRWADILVEGT